MDGINRCPCCSITITVAGKGGFIHSSTKQARLHQMPPPDAQDAQVRVRRGHLAVVRPRQAVAEFGVLRGSKCVSADVCPRMAADVLSSSVSSIRDLFLSHRFWSPSARETSSICRLCGGSSAWVEGCAGVGSCG